jgi:drug/metabolite transporter (DMT)-like permease
LNISAASPRYRSALIALFVVFLWATSWVLIKLGLQEIPPLTFAGLRYTLAFICLLPFAVTRHRNSALAAIQRRTLRQLILLGLLLYTVTQGAIFLALAYLPAVTVNLLWSFTTGAVALMGIGLLAEQPSFLQWTGILIAALGAVIYFYPAGSPQFNLAGIIVSILGVFANAAAVILGRSINRSGELHPLVVTAVSMGAGSITLLLAGLVTQGLPAITTFGWAIIFWLAIVNTAIAFTLWNHTLRTLSAAESSVINGTMLIWIPILAVVFLGETITTVEGLGLIAAAIGTLIAQLKSPSGLKPPFRKDGGN